MVGKLQAEHGIRFRNVEQGAGSVERVEGEGYRLQIAPGAGYSNAQLCDYGGRPAGGLAWRPPVRLTLEARFVGRLERFPGTAGFGFWNAPFGGGRMPRLPVTNWFFLGGRACDMQFAFGVEGRGWKAACMNAHRPWGYGLAAAAPLGLPAFRSARLYRRFWPWVQRRLGIGEASLGQELLAEWHEYAIEWGEGGSEFRIDNERMFGHAGRIAGPLGLVVWIDNQYAQATPRGRLRWGIADLESSVSLEVRGIRIE